MWTPEEIAKLEAVGRRVIIGRERPGSWHEMLAHQKAINDAHDKVVDLSPTEYKVD